MSPEASQNPIFVALDTPSTEQALAIAKAVRRHVGGVKVGLEFISAQGPQGIRAIVATGLPVFVDVKFHDIPNTVAGAVRSIAPLGAAFINVHTTGGAAMMAAAAAAAAEFNPRPKVLGVTVLTSLDARDLESISVTCGPLEQVVRLARLAQSSGLDGVICSPQEIAAVRDACGPDFLIVTPGVRPAGSSLDDQRRVTTPAKALAAGADYLVIGRPITAAADPGEAAREIAADLAGLLAAR
jgi:orotidine-5'-phosphate decarboxylase